MASSSLRARRLALAVFAASCTAGAAGTAGCGSRTGLFGPDGLAYLDGSVGLDGSKDGGKDAGQDAKVQCQDGTFTMDLAVAQLMFVIDRSGSMGFTIDGQQKVPPGELSRWQILQAALRTQIKPIEGQIAMGATFFPRELTEAEARNSERACDTEDAVPIAPAVNNADAILNVFDDTTPRGGTPTSAGLRVAADFLVGSRGVGRTIILATDGAPNCNDALDYQTCICTTPGVDCSNDPQNASNCLDDVRTVSVIQQIAQQQKIPVYVIGIGTGDDNVVFLKVLDDMAQAGGRPKAATPPYSYNVRSANDLKLALQTIGEQVANCTYLTPSAPTNPDQIEVRIAGAKIKHDLTHTDGWDWIDKELGELEFFGDACKQAGTSGAQAVTGTVSCEPR